MRKSFAPPDSARFFVDFSAREACGKAVPCRIGTKRLVEAMGGGLTVDSRVGRGSVFTVTLPLMVPSEAGPPEKPAGKYRV